MRINRILKVGKGIEGADIWDIKLEAPLDQEAISELALLGKLSFCCDLPKRLFCVATRSGSRFKGVEGDYSFRLEAYAGEGQNLLDRLSELSADQINIA